MENTSNVLGYVVDFCPICRGLRPFSIRSLSESGKINGYIKKCLECNVSGICDYKLYQHVEKKRSNSVEILMKNTFPHAREHYHNRLLLERYLEENPKKVSKEERNELLLEPFEIFMPILQRRLSEEYYIDNTVITLITSAIIAFLSFIISLLCSVPAIYLLAIGCIFILISGLTIYELMTNNQRYLTSKVLPTLGKTLSVLKPTVKEIQTIFQNYKETKGDFVDKIPLNLLMQEIAENSVADTW